jgi:2-dehydro-3-deoxy-D-gluconate 5-dehydrogenase
MAADRREIMSRFDLTGRAAVVTGGNRGIGLGMARGLAQAGAAVVIAGRDKAKNAKAVAELREAGARAVDIVADVTQEESCRALVATAVETFGRLDILVNNAGIGIINQPQDDTLAEWNAVLATNLSSAFLCAQASYPEMLRAGGGKVINIGSMTSIFGAAFAASYAASKGGIVQLTKSLATAWAKDNIQANVVLPGWIDTDLTRDARAKVQGLHEGVLARTPAGRWGVPDDLAGIAVFLASPASDFITGAAIPVDGGYSVQG